MNARLLISSVAMGVLVLIGGCAATSLQGIKYVQASDVINELKDELAQVDAQPIDTQVLVPSDACGVKLNSTQNAVHITAQFATADVVLKTIATDSASESGSAAKLPLGVVLLGSSLTLTQTSIRTQQVTYTLINDKLAETDAGTGVPSRTNRAYTPAAGHYIPIHHVGSSAPVTPEDAQPPAGVPPPLLIAKALAAARDQILAIDHARKPCLLPKSVKVEIDFQIQEKSDGKADVGFLTFLDVGTETVRQREHAQSVTVTFALSGSSVAFQ